MFSQFISYGAMAAFAGYALYTYNKRKGLMQTLGPAMRPFFEQTGYRFSDQPTAPMNQQLALAGERMRDYYAGKGELNLVRDYHGLSIHHMMKSSFSSANTVSYFCSWTIALQAPPRVEWQAADKRLTGVGKAVKEAFSNSSRSWEAKFPKVESGDGELDKKLNFYGNDAEAVRRVLLSPGLKEALLVLSEVDLDVTSKGVRFSDPMQKNLLAAMGGKMGAMTIGTDFAAAFQLTLPVHEQIAELLALSVRASR